MSKNQFQTDQMKNDAALSEIAPSAGTTLATILSNSNARSVDPCSLSFTGSSLVLTMGNSIITTGPSGKKKGLSQLSNVYLGSLSGTIDMSTGTGTGIQSITLPAKTANRYRRFGVEIRKDKNVYVVYGTEGTVDSDLSTAGAPAFSKNTDQVGEFYLLVNSGGTAYVTPTNTNITQFGAGGSGGGSGSGIGGINYVDNFDAEIDTSGWRTYADAAGAYPVDGTGGAPDITLARTTSNPLRSTASFLLTKPASNCQGQGVSVDLLTLDVEDRGRLINISIDYEATSFNNNLQVFLLDTSNSFALVTPYSDGGFHIGKGTLNFQFLAPATVGPLRLCFHIGATSAVGWTMKFDNVVVGPESLRESIKQDIFFSSHSCSVGDVISFGSGWSKASASNISTSRNLALVVDVIDSNNLVALFKGWCRLPSPKASGLWYLSETLGATVNTDNQKYSVPVYSFDAYGACIFNPGEPRRVTEEGDVSFRPYKTVTSTAYLSGGAIQLSSGEVLVSATGATAQTEALVKIPISIDLSTVTINETATNGHTYYLYIDRNNLPASTTLTDSGRKVTPVYLASHFYLSTVAPDAINTFRYVNVGYFYYTGSGWSTGPIGFTPSRIHDLLSDFYSTTEVYKSVSINTNTVTDLTHNLSGTPQIIQMYFYDSSVSERQPLDASSYIRKASATTITVDSNGFTFDSGDYLEVEAVYTPTTPSQIASLSTQFESPWFQDTATTTLAHNRTDMNDLKGIVVQEWDVTLGRRRIIPVDALVTEWDDVNLYLNWAGLVPSATLQYRITTGGNALPQAIPYQFGGFTKYVGMGMGSYGTLAAALAAAASGDAILVGRSETISSTVTVSLNDIKIEFMANVKLTASGTPTNALVVSGSRNRIVSPWVDSGVALTSAIQISGDDNFVEGAKVTNTAGAITNAYEFTSTAERNWVNGIYKANGGTITNGVIDAVPANSNDYSVRG